MMNRVNRSLLGRVAASFAMCALAAASVLVTGCSKEEPPPAPPPPPPRPAAPERATLDNVIMDPRVQFPEDRLPTSQSLVEAVASLATALATGDDLAMSSLLDPSGEAVLATLLETGEWQSATSGIEAVRVVALEGGDGSARVGLAVQDPAGAYVLGWSAEEQSGRWLFRGLAIKTQTAARANELDSASLEEQGVAAPRPAAPPPPPPPKPDDRPSSRPGSSSPGGPDGQPPRPPGLPG